VLSVNFEPKSVVEMNRPGFEYESERAQHSSRDQAEADNQDLVVYHVSGRYLLGTVTIWVIVIFRRKPRRDRSSCSSILSSESSSISAVSNGFNGVACERPKGEEFVEGCWLVENSSSSNVSNSLPENLFLSLFINRRTCAAPSSKFLGSVSKCVLDIDQNQRGRKDYLSPNHPRQLLLEGT